MRLATLLPDQVRGPGPNPPVAGLAYDSRRVKPGFLFFCIPGFRQDGHDFVEDARRRGAVAAVVERPVDTLLPAYRVDSSRRALARASAAYYGHPGSRLHVVGISGTNGKTTVSYWLDSIYRCCGFQTGLIGTIQYRYRGWTQPAGMTTPESLELQALLSRMLTAGVSHVVMEVSSHALALERVAGLAFDTVVLTNVTHDHLDFHRDLTSYREVKAGFVRNLRPDGKGSPLAVVNADDPFCSAIAPGEGVRRITFGLTPPADVRPRHWRLERDGTRAVIDLGGDPVPVRLRLPGLFNLANALAAAAAAFGQGVEPGRIREGLEALTGVPGRCETVDAAAGFRVVIDFAHNPDALARLLTLPPPQVTGRRILVFGCEGGKDRLKRPLMGAIAARAADRIVLTCDNVHHEDPEQIFGEVLAGLRDASGRYEVVPDRRLAIRRALETARRGDLVLVAGKGHERNLIVRGECLPFDDREVVNELLGINDDGESDQSWPREVSASRA